AHPMNGPREEPLARPRLSCDEHGGRGGGNALGEIAHLPHRTAAPNELRQRERIAERALESGRLTAEPRFVDGSPEKKAELVDQKRLRQVVIGSAPNRLDGGIDGAVSGHDDDGALRRDLSRRRKKIEAIGPGHAEIRNERVEILAEALLSVLARA